MYIHEMWIGSCADSEGRNFCDDGCDGVELVTLCSL